MGDPVAALGTYTRALSPGGSHARSLTAGVLVLSFAHVVAVPLAANTPSNTGASFTSFVAVHGRFLLFCYVTVASTAADALSAARHAIVHGIGEIAPHTKASAFKVASRRAFKCNWSSTTLA